MCAVRTSDAGVGQEPAVDRDDNAGDEGGVVGDEVAHGAAEVAGLAELAHGRLGDDLVSAGGEGLAVLLQHEEAVLVGDEEAGGDGVDADAHGREVGGEPAGEVLDGGLGGGVGGDLGEGLGGGHGGDVHDGTAGGEHLLGEDLRGEQRADEVEAVDELEALDVEAEEGLLQLGVGGHLLGGAGALGVVAAGAVDEDVHAAPLGEDGVARGLKGGTVEDVGAEGEGLGEALGGEGGGEGFGLLAVEVKEGDLGAVAEEVLGHHGAEDAGGAGNDDDLAIEVAAVDEAILKPAEFGEADEAPAVGVTAVAGAAFVDLHEAAVVGADDDLLAAAGLLVEENAHEAGHIDLTAEVAAGLVEGAAVGVDDVAEVDEVDAV